MAESEFVEISKHCLQITLVSGFWGVCCIALQWTTFWLFKHIPSISWSSPSIYVEISILKSFFFCSANKYTLGDKQDGDRSICSTKQCNWRELHFFTNKLKLSKTFLDPCCSFREPLLPAFLWCNRQMYEIFINWEVQNCRMKKVCKRRKMPQLVWREPEKWKIFTNNVFFRITDDISVAWTEKVKNIAIITKSFSSFWFKHVSSNFFQLNFPQYYENGAQIINWYLIM